MMRRVLLLMLAGSLAAGVLVACGDDDDDESTPATQDARDDDATSTVEEGDGAEHNDADVTFAQVMIAHHQQAVDMAMLAAARAEDPRVVALGERIEAAQAPEIEQMESWLATWEVDDEMRDMGDDMSPGADMMSETDMAALEAASGPDVDIMFLDMMIEHHRGAIETAQAEIAEGENAEAIALAEQIVAAQTDEIAEMEGLLAEPS